MELQNVIEKRRSIRKYDAGKVITEKELSLMISAAQYAPSWKNQQTSRYYCILDKKQCEDFSKLCLPEFNQKNTINACAYIVTTFVKDCAGFDFKTHLPVNEVGNGWGYYDLGLQNQNLLLKATELGYATLVMGIRDSESIRTFFTVPDQEEIVSVIAMGYSNYKPDMPVRKTLEEIMKIL